MTDEKRQRDTPEPEDVIPRTQELSQKTNLSDREAEFLSWKELGYTHEEIAEKMDVQKGTIDTYAHRVKTKYKHASETVSEVREQFDSKRTEKQGIHSQRADSNRVQKGDQVAVIRRDSDDPYIRTDVIGEVVRIRDDETPRRVLIQIGSDNHVEVSESTVIEARNSPRSASPGNLD